MVFVACNSRSESVVLPWSMWAMMPKIAREFGTHEGASDSKGNLPNYNTIRGGFGSPLTPALPITGHAACGEDFQNGVANQLAVECMDVFKSNITRDIFNGYG